MDNVVFHCNHTNTYAMKKIGKRIPTSTQQKSQQKPIKNTHMHTQFLKIQK